MNIPGTIRMQLKAAHEIQHGQRISLEKSANSAPLHTELHYYSALLSESSLQPINIYTHTQ